MRHAYPMLLDVTARRIVIVGGGSVAVRKAAGLIEAGATDIHCVALRVDPAMPNAVRKVLAKYEAAYLDGAGLVFAATDAPDVNDAVVRDARARGVLACRADTDEDGPGDFATPAKFKEGGVTVAVAAAGNPALAVLIRDGLRSRWDARWTALCDAMRTIRPLVKSASELSPQARRTIFRELASEEALGVVASGGADGLRSWLHRRYPGLIP